jgi:hypothetical protein
MVSRQKSYVRPQSEARPQDEHHRLTIQWIDDNWEAKAKPAILKVISRKMRWVTVESAEDIAHDLLIKILQSSSIGRWIAGGNAVSPWELANWAYQDLLDDLEKQAQDASCRGHNPALRTRSERKAVVDRGPSGRPVHSTSAPFKEHRSYDEEGCVSSKDIEDQSDDALSFILMKEVEASHLAAIRIGFPQGTERMETLYQLLREDKVRSEIAPILGVSKSRCATLVQNLRWCLRHGPEEMRRLRKHYGQ